ncbi:unnamed protein product [Darwinula stevensoni]|uniref:Uncharacterized protein n=1 Tax=Darwinula stevensoni TaxID=69355 RepID=A0A7R9FN45_9CRUS|nr:unnamed protein product [Darwinula stevensoni]CAG0896368.1 unnamed protein product [Darwinula stevensoni]
MSSESAHGGEERALRIEAGKGGLRTHSHTQAESESSSILQTQFGLVRSLTVHYAIAGGLARVPVYRPPSSAPHKHKQALTGRSDTLNTCVTSPFVDLKVHLSPLAHGHRFGQCVRSVCEIVNEKLRSTKTMKRMRFLQFLVILTVAFFIQRLEARPAAPELADHVRAPTLGALVLRILRKFGEFGPPLIYECKGWFCKD